MIISLTSIPSRFKYLQSIIDSLRLQGSYDIWVNIPWKYNRFPDEEVVVPELKGAIINRCEDYGPGTMYFGPVESNCADDLIVCVNDDTLYPPHMCTYYKFLNENVENVCWCMSGFRVDEYVQNNGLVRRYHNEKIDVTESYGGVILRLEWLRNIFNEFKEMLIITYNDDILVSNLLAKHNIQRKSVCDKNLNIGMIKQYSYGMEDGLFLNNGEGSHVPNNKRVFQTLKDKGMYYYNHS